MKEGKSPIDCLYDENNNDTIILYDEENNEIPFEQVALIPLREKMYAILAPAQPMEGVGEDEALVFVIETLDSVEGEECLVLVKDEEIIQEVFEIYNDLIEESVLDEDEE